MNWTKVTISAPGFVGGQAVRSHLHRTGSLPPEFFHHDEHGNPLCTPPPVRMFGNGYRVSILGIGEEGRELVLSNMKPVLEAFPRASAQFDTGTFRIFPSRENNLLDIHSCVLRIPQQYTPALVAGQYRQVDGIVSSVIGRALRQQVAMLCPEIREIVATTPVQAAVYRSVSVEVKAGRYLPAINCLLRMPFKLVGPWQLGSLQSRGYGRCRRAASPEVKARHLVGERSG